MIHLTKHAKFSAKLTFRACTFQGVSKVSFSRKFYVRIKQMMPYLASLSLHKKRSFSLRISPVNVTQSAGHCEFGHIYRRILNGKLHFLCSVLFVAFLLVRQKHVLYIVAYISLQYSRVGDIKIVWNQICVNNCSYIYFNAFQYSIALLFP